MFLMYGIVIFCDVFYMNRITYAITREDNPIVIGPSTMYIDKAYHVLQAHIVVLAITIVLIVLLPVYSKMLRKINTSIEVEDNGKMGEIDISSEN